MTSLGLSKYKIYPAICMVFSWCSSQCFFLNTFRTSHISTYHIVGNENPMMDRNPIYIYIFISYPYHIHIHIYIYISSWIEIPSKKPFQNDQIKAISDVFSPLELRTSRLHQWIHWNGAPDPLGKQKNQPSQRWWDKKILTILWKDRTAFPQTCGKTNGIFKYLNQKNVKKCIFRMKIDMSRYPAW